MNISAELKKTILERKRYNSKITETEAEIIFKLEADLAFFTEDRHVEYKYIRKT